ncbi:MucB/RseB C-terminal domain-containing protein [Paludibacterium paludis]|uniref:Sigma E factor regulatory protein n=1 Tax=Paludibacterium paludis TaxID=1225769 RepID=A0A918NZ78_9NEIS|nr:MucB/RseB C-terminal domain-containing protein [Paludibacterium paludis]GGY06396.1 sigma E factor regulatory protein [Paludibacterium paludis]
MRAVLLAAGLAATGLAHSAFASDEDWQLLKKAELAGGSQPLSATYLHQMNGMLETFRLFRSGSPDAIVERRISLDGVPREVIRQGDVLTCYAQDRKALNAAKVSAMRLFPDVLSEHLDTVSQSYAVKRLGRDRVAQRDCNLLELRPRDRQRFTVRLCLDTATALPLRMVTLSPGNDTVEQYTFTELDLTPPRDRQQFKPQYKVSARIKGAGQAAASAPAAREAAMVDVQGLPPGFRMLRAVQRSLPGSDRAVRHLVFSDGLAMLSLFIEPVQGEAKPDRAINLHGAISMVAVSSGGQQITLVGDLPESALAAMAKNIRVQSR